jgi:hypothetical protein
VCNGKQSYLHGAVGFAPGDNAEANKQPVAPENYPIQRFMWWDYYVKPGDKVRYSVVPVMRLENGQLKADAAAASPETEEMEITGQCTPHLSAYFNKGIVAAQWVSRALQKLPASSKIKNVVATKNDPLRNALSGLLRPQILTLLADADEDNGVIYAALYELNDVELIAALKKMGKRCNLILANGAFKSDSPHENDENADVRTDLHGKVNLFNRIVKKGHYAHNKFVVFCDKDGNPRRVLTGSTNWTSSGLCTQANNGLVIEDANVAKQFLAAWNRLKEAGDNYTQELVDGNSVSQTQTVDGCAVTPWFVKTSAQQDLEFARKLINGAQQGILFLFFNPGKFQDDPRHWTLLQNILERHNENYEHYNGDLYFCGVVNQDIPKLTTFGPPKKGKKQPDAALDPTTAVESPVTLYKSGISPPLRLSHDVLVPHNIKRQFFGWEKELLGASMVNIHSKVIVLDPFGSHPVLMTGSHNLGFKASNANDDNLVIIEGNAPLAAAYAINILAMYGNYRWNSYVEAHRQDPKVWHGPVDRDDWQQGYLQGAKAAELEFWLGQTLGGGIAKKGDLAAAVRTRTGASRPRFVTTGATRALAPKGRAMR